MLKRSVPTFARQRASACRVLALLRTRFTSATPDVFVSAAIWARKYGTKTSNQGVAYGSDESQCESDVWFTTVHKCDDIRVATNTEVRNVLYAVAESERRDAVAEAIFVAMLRRRGVCKADAQGYLSVRLSKQFSTAAKRGALEHHNNLLVLISLMVSISECDADLCSMHHQVGTQNRTVSMSGIRYWKRNRIVDLRASNIRKPEQRSDAQSSQSQK